MIFLHWSAAAEQAQALCDAWPADGPGGAILGFDRNGLHFAITGGVERVGEHKAFTPDTVVRWASVTKHVFAAFVLDSGLPLDAMLGSLLPMHPVPGAVTVRQALAMQGGLPDTREMLTLLGLGGEVDTRAPDLLAWSAGIGRLNAEPGTEVAYSNAGYRLVEAALEARGLRFTEWVAAQGHGIAAPDYWNEPVTGLVPGHVMRDGVWVQGGQGMHLSAAGALAGSATQLASWLADLMDRDAFASLAQPVPLRDGRPTGYGLGLRLTRIGDRLVPGHGGAQSGYRSGFLLDPALGAGICVVTNRDDGEATAAAEAVMTVLLGVLPDAEPARDWAPPGLYVAEEGNLWAEVRPASIVVRDAEEKLFAAGDEAISHAPQSEIRLRWTGKALEGEIGHLPVCLHPAQAEPLDEMLDGWWECDGATFRIAKGQVHWGAGPRAERSDLVALGNGRWLFQALGRRICLRRLGADRVELSLSRARVVEYVRLSA
ncbi:serine hydrolase domain-containing protein [Falsirhodobacter sp. 20TX0035]|uniref:serine hydrolase domain-containing protein n=1 Tax=Falsirhodobacter sp. 20TX0035 TaxID=3022019 RepID=UPI00232CF626|nr:serine hydrolase domain-containing protein [Falsirhodobacter sp. 20TX0035]MDB6454822.1 serine hydrolase [Falsirhodobacter sp. 20TX0035]